MEQIIYYKIIMQKERQDEIEIYDVDPWFPYSFLMLQTASLQSVLQDGLFLLHSFRMADTNPLGAIAAHAACANSSSVNASIITIIRYKKKSWKIYSK